MSKSAQLKRKAAEFEQKRQYDRALAVYAQAIEAAAGIPEELDIPLYNRVGDLQLRLGDLEKAVAYYETAVDLYAEGGFFNNAIALCNKVLRHSPGRAVIYYKLGKISARKGFNSDAKQNFLEYAARMEKAGDANEAFRALKEFADLCPGQDDVRLMLAEQLARADRTNDAIEQLQIVHEVMIAEDRPAEAAATLERIRALDPDFAPRAGMARQAAKREGLVFIDLEPAKRSEVDAAHLAGPAEVHPLSAEAFGQVALPDEVAAVRMGEESPLAGLQPVTDPLGPMISEQERGPAPALSEFETTTFTSPESAGQFAPLDIDRTSFESPAFDPTAFQQTSLEELSAEPTAQISENLDAIGPDSGAGSPELPEEGDSIADHDMGDPLPDGLAKLDVDQIGEADDSVAGLLSGYVESLSSDVGEAEGGLPSDLGILPPEAIAEEQSVPGIRSDDDFVDLNQWLLEDEAPRNPRMTAEGEDESASQVQTDFTSMLETFKAGVAANVDESDTESHYDLGVAYMEMGLHDEAIAQFQKVLRSDAPTDRRVRAYESLGQSFIAKNDFEVAMSSLEGALKESGLGDTKLVGVLYLLGFASEKLLRWQGAEGYYRRVFAVDVNFRDVAERLRNAEQHA